MDLQSIALPLSYYDLLYIIIYIEYNQKVKVMNFDFINIGSNPIILIIMNII